MKPITAIPGRADFYIKWLVPRRPMWLRLGDVAKLGWRTDRWTPDYLAGRAGSHPVKVLHRKEASGTYQPENTEYVSMVFGEFVNRVLRRVGGTDELYLNLQEGHAMEPPLLQLTGDFAIPDFYCEAPIRSINLWLGRSRRGIVTVLHHDYEDNVYVVVRGNKRISLFPPGQAANLYPRGDLVRVRDNGIIEYRDMKHARMPHLSRVDPDAPDLDRYPGYSEAAASRIDCALETGDVLFIPAGWFHQVRSLPGDHAAVSFFAQAPELEGLRRLRNRGGQTPDAVAGDGDRKLAC